MSSGGWPCIAAAQRRRVPRVPLRAAPGGVRIGSVAVEHLSALGRWPQRIAVAAGEVVLRLEGDAGAELAAIHATLRDEGLIRAWRGEAFTLWEPASMRPLGTIERAAARFWGTLTLGAHANGYVAGTDGRPAAMWIARRSLTKPTDPGKLDNLVGGGVAHGQTPFDALVREGWEEAGLDAATMAAATPGRVIEIDADIAEGRQHEHLHTWDLRLAPGVVPRNQDGEVAVLECLPVADAIARAAGGEMTVDAALVVLDFALRHRLLDPGGQRVLADRAAGLWAGRAPSASR